MSTSVACKTEQQRQQQMIFVLVLEKKANGIDKKLILSQF